MDHDAAVWIGCIMSAFIVMALLCIFFTVRYSDGGWKEWRRRIMEWHDPRLLDAQRQHGHQMFRPDLNLKTVPWPWQIEKRPRVEPPPSGSVFPNRNLHVGADGSSSVALNKPLAREMKSFASITTDNSSSTLGSNETSMTPRVALCAIDGWTDVELNVLNSNGPPATVGPISKPTPTARSPIQCSLVSTNFGLNNKKPTSPYDSVPQSAPVAQSPAQVDFGAAVTKPEPVKQPVSFPRSPVQTSFDLDDSVPTTTKPTSDHQSDLAARSPIATNFFRPTTPKPGSPFTLFSRRHQRSGTPETPTSLAIHITPASPDSQRTIRPSPIQPDMAKLHTNSNTCSTLVSSQTASSWTDTTSATSDGFENVSVAKDWRATRQKALFRRLAEKGYSDTEAEVIVRGGRKSCEGLSKVKVAE